MTKRVDNLIIAEKIADTEVVDLGYYSKQPNTLLQSTHIWRQRSFFDISYTDDIDRDTTALFDNWITKASMKLWNEKPKDNKGFVWLSFADFGRLLYKTNRLNPEQNKDIKYGLLRLGGNMFPYTKPNEKGTINFGVMQFLEIEFETNIPASTFNSLENKDKIGTRLLSILDEGKGQKITRVGIRPNPRFIDEMQGKGQGYTWLKDNAISDLRGRLSEAGTKWFDYISQCKLDKQSIKLDTLIRRFGWKEKLASKGKPKCFELALTGFQECIDINHIYPEQVVRGNKEGSYYITEKELFAWQRTREFVNKKKAIKAIPADKDNNYYITKLSKLIKRNKWTITSTAEKLGVERAYLSKILSGRARGGQELISKIREMTG